MTTLGTTWTWMVESNDSKGLQNRARRTAGSCTPVRCKVEGGNAESCKPDWREPNWRDNARRFTSRLVCVVPLSLDDIEDDETIIDE